MNERVSIFSNLASTPAFETKPKKDKPVAEDMIADVAREHNFPSREAKKVTKAEKRTPRRYRTGRNVQFQAKATAETCAKIYKQADELKLTMVQWLELAVEVIDREQGARKKQSAGE